MIPIFKEKDFIPTGTNFSILLNSEHISYGEIQSTLKQKGVFVRDTEKSNTVPILSSILLKPSEFKSLVESSIVREQKTKIRSPQKLSLTKVDADWLTPLKDDLCKNSFNPCENIDNVKLLSPIKTIIEGKNRIKIPYTIRRTDYSKDYLKRDLDFSGEISIEQTSNSLELKFSSSHTSPETEKINKRISNKIKSILKASNAIESDSEIKITFGSFSTVERVRFFKRLTGGVDDLLKRGAINNMEIHRDVNGPELPNDPQISWMKHSVTHLKVNGEKLNSIFLIAEEKYYPYYNIQRLDVTFPYTIGTNEGNCRIGFFFSNAALGNIAEDAELNAEFSKVNYSKKSKINNDAKKDIENKLQFAIENMLEKEFDKIISERQKTA